MHPSIPRAITLSAALALLSLAGLGPAVAGASPAASLIPADRGAFTPTGSPAILRSDEGAAAQLNDGRVLVAGSGATGTSAETRDPSSGSFIPTGPMANPRWGGETATLWPDRRVLVVGGYGDAGDPAEAELWEPSTGAFEPAGSLNGPVARGAALLRDGRVFVGSAVTLGEIWDPRTMTFTPAGPASDETYGRSVTLLPDGRVLVAGGYASGPPQTAAVLWDPLTSGTEATGSLTVARAFHTATALADGRVLITGGEDGSAAARAEVYELR